MSAPQSVITRVLADLTPVTPYTVTQPGRMNRQLARVREHGYAVTREEMSLGACSLAVPIVADGAVVAALGIVVPTLESHLTRLTVALRVAAGGIGRSLDHERRMTSGQ